MDRCRICDQKPAQVRQPGLKHFAPDRWLLCDGCGVIASRLSPTAQEFTQWYGEEPLREPPAPVVQNGTAKQKWLTLLAQAHAGASLKNRFWRLALHPLGAHFQGLPSMPPPGRVLDIGCGDGHWLSIMRALGWETFGIERDPRRRANARNHPAGIWEGDLNHYPWDKKPFTIIRMWHVLEHLPDPKAALRQVQPWLDPQGELIVGVPNARGWMAHLFGKDWSGVEYPKHLFHFNARALHQALESSGYSQVRVRFSSCATFLDSLGLKFGSAGRRLASNGAVRLASIYLDRFMDLLHAGDGLEARARVPLR